MKSYEKYPFYIPFLSILVSWIIYFIGAYILYKFGLIFSIIYLLYCFTIELNILFKSCKYCYYYGKLCGLGRGRIAHMLVKKGNPNKFLKKEINWLMVLPDFLIFFIPLIGGIISLIINFSLIILISLILLIILFLGGTATIRGNLVCKYCKQRELGCPAEKLFNKKKK